MKAARRVFLASLLLAVGSLAFAQRGGGQYLGQSNVDGIADHDLIRVGKSDGTFRAIQLRVAKGAIEFNRVIIHYGNGVDEPIAIRERIPAGGQSRMIDLPGERRVIQGVEIYYEKANWGRRRPQVRLFGFR